MWLDFGRGLGREGGKGERKGRGETGKGSESEKEWRE